MAKECMLSIGKLTLGGLPRNTVVRITDRTDMTLWWSSVLFAWRLYSIPWDVTASSTRGQRSANTVKAQCVRCERRAMMTGPFYAPNFEKVGDILVSACPCVCVRVWGIEISS